jgi:hypothetical protein
MLQSISEADVTTLLHSYRLVAALLYRMQDRSSDAENAWHVATAGDITDPAMFDQTSVLRINAARNKAIATITDRCPSEAVRAHAIVAIDEAVRTAVAIELRESVVAQTAEVAAG